MNSLIKAIEKIISVAFLVMCTMVFLQAVLRYAFKKPIYWEEELSLSLFTWVSFVGAALALRKSRHSRITFLIDKLPQVHKEKIEIFGHVLVAVISAVIFYQSVKYFDLAKTIILPAIKVPSSYVSFAITFASFLMFIFSIEAIVDIVRKKNREAGLKTKL